MPIKIALTKLPARDEQAAASAQLWDACITLHDAVFSSSLMIQWLLRIICLLWGHVHFPLLLFPRSDNYVCCD